MQIRIRLTIQFILIVAGILIASLFYIHFQFKTNLRSEFFDNLRSKALMTAEMIIGKHTEIESLILSPSEPNGLLSATYTENVSIYDPSTGKRVYTFNPSPDYVRSTMLGEILAMKECRFVHGKFDALGVLYTTRTGKNFIIISEAVFNPAHLDNLVRILLWVFFIAIALVAVGGWFFARQALAPVSDIMNQVDALLPSNLDKRLETFDRKDELSRLAVTFNKLLDRIQGMFKLQKMFLSNISHELKNPLNVIISQIEITLYKDRPKEDYRQTLVSVLADVKDLNETADKLMQMARISAGGPAIQFQPQRIDEMIWQAKATLLKSHPEYRISFEVVNLPEQEEKLLVLANDQLMKTALLNLMDNGCKFSPERNVKVRLSFTPEGGTAIEIEDKGPGIQQDELPLVFEAFYRSQKTAAVKGSGVGLSLVESIMKLHRVELSVASQEGTGTTFKLKFPPISTN